MGGLEGNTPGPRTTLVTNAQQPSTSTHFQRSNSISSSSTGWSSAQSTPRTGHQHSNASHPHQPNHSNHHLPVPDMSAHDSSQVHGASSFSVSPSSSSSSRTARRGGPSSFFCFGLLMVHSTFVTLVVFDLLLLSHSLIFTISNYLNGERAYSDAGSSHERLDKTKGLIVAANNLPYSLLIPLFGVQVFWLVSAILALISLKTVQPYWQLPYLMVSGIVLFATMWLIIQTIQTLAISSTVDWALALTLSFSNVVFLVQIYFLYIKIACIKALLRKRKSVVSTVTSEAKIMCSSHSKSKANLSMPTDSCNQSPSNTNRSRPQDDDTFSTQSTVVISDGNSWDTPRLPHKSALKLIN